MNSIPVLHLIEDLRLALEMLALPQEREALLSQIPGPTASYIKEWFEDSLVSVSPWPDKGIVGYIISNGMYPAAFPERWAGHPVENL